MKPRLVFTHKDTTRLTLTQLSTELFKWLPVDCRYFLTNYHDVNKIVHDRNTDCVALELLTVLVEQVLALRPVPMKVLPAAPAPPKPVHETMD